MRHVSHIAPTRAVAEHLQVIAYSRHIRAQMRMFLRVETLEKRAQLCAQTCKAFLEVTRERSVWFDACYRHVVEGKIPTPGFNMETITQMSSDELEKSIQRAWLYRRNWTSPSPQPTRRTDIPPPTAPEDLKICRGLSAAFIPGHGGRYLIAFSRLELHNRTRMFVLECWDLRPHRPRRVATYTCKDALNYTVNSDGTHPAVVAVTRRGNDG